MLNSNIKTVLSDTKKAVTDPTTLRGAAIGGAINGAPGAILGGIFGKDIANANPFKDRTPFKPDSLEDIMATLNANMPQYQSVLTGSNELADKYRLSSPAAIKAGLLNAGQLDIGKLSANQDALNALKARAMAQGDSPWLRMQLDKLKLDETTARDRAAAQGLSASAQANSALAMRGGLNSGARERIAMGGARDLNAMRQGIGRDSATNRLNLGIADDQTKMGLLSQIPGMDVAFANQAADLNKFNIGTKLDADKANIANQLSADQFNTNLAYDTNKTNIANTLAGVSDVNKFNLGKYAEQMKGYGAGKTGEAIAAGGKK